MVRMRAKDTKVSSTLKALHAKSWASIDARRSDATLPEVSSKVWCRPETQPGTAKLATKWTRGTRRARHSHVLQLAPEAREKEHRIQLQLHAEDQISTDPLPLFNFNDETPSPPRGGTG